MHYKRAQPQQTLKYKTIKLFGKWWLHSAIIMITEIINAKGTHIAATVELFILFYASFDFIDILQ